ncbi:MAG: type 1 glutamine amidotransferase-like domain-containing protein [Candidatus Eisenbacteria bacterium]|uniref:Type 1 glutamine amidotransferase-like domain-containing protein n=1 Tax=Eiseniibacteriota bacterium TaxID=2212470 RepID=A0A7Y2EDJ9_UNCEI|nr:type 1 glutamine amidotransferase-like domain-containing protein [Candidatus Eisenbacteria bacterium]
MSAKPSLFLFGPQRLQPILDGALKEHGIGGPIALITAGWQEREEDDQELLDHVGRDAFNLRLYHRSHIILSQDRELSLALHARQSQLKALQKFYRVRLSYALGAVEELQSRLIAKEEVPAATQSLEKALSAARDLDEEHLEHIAEIHAAFDKKWSWWERDSVRQGREEIAKKLEGVETIALAGGHVAVLLNRLRLFGMEEQLRKRTILAWSAGAMCLGDRVVLFHDRPPQGRGYAEVLERGFGIAEKLLPFPHARHRLDLKDPHRVQMLAGRFPDHECVPMNEGARCEWTPGKGWVAKSELKSMKTNGTLEPAVMA